MKMLAIICLVLMGCAGGYEPVPLGAPTHPMPGYAVMCQEYPESISCQSKVQEIFWHVKENFTYVSDDEHFGVPEYWRSFVHQVKDGNPFRGDCDNFAVTLAELWVLEGVPPDRIQLAYVRGRTGHLVAIHNGWVYDNARRDILRWEDTGYEWIKGMSLGEPGVWRLIN